jgi:hypothetical protein
MAREQWHKWGQTVVTIATLIFVCGLTYSRIEINTSDITDIEADVKVVEGDVHTLQIKQERDIALKEALLKTATRMEAKMDAMSVEQNLIKLDVNSTKIKVDTLIKD